jgi:hypothetical protein
MVSLLDVYVDVADLRDEYVICRTIGHRWDDHPSPELDSQMWAMSAAALALRCSRCTTERFDFYLADLTVYHRYYRYPPGYRTTRGSNVSRVAMREVLYERDILLRRAEAAVTAEAERIVRQAAKTTAKKAPARPRKTRSVA